MSPADRFDEESAIALAVGQYYMHLICKELKLTIGRGERRLESLE